MKKRYASLLVGIIISISAIFFLIRNHQKTIRNQIETPTDSDCCWEGDICDSIRFISDSIKKEIDSLNKIK